ncbi:hypothetical protein HK096_010648, partial [Nowakowskiella sp. JEL0078]
VFQNDYYSQCVVGTTSKLPSPIPSPSPSPLPSPLPSPVQSPSNSPTPSPAIPETTTSAVQLSTTSAVSPTPSTTAGTITLVTVLAVTQVTTQQIPSFPNPASSNGNNNYTILVVTTVISSIPTSVAQTTDSKSNFDFQLALGLVCSLIVAVVALFIGTFIWWKKKRQNKDGNPGIFGKNRDNSGSQITLESLDHRASQTFAPIYSAKLSTMWEDSVPPMRTENDTFDSDNFKQSYSNSKHNKTFNRDKINTNLVELSHQNPMHARNNSEGTYVASSPMTPQDSFSFGARYHHPNYYPSHLDPEIPFAPPPNMPVPPIPTSPTSLKGPTHTFAPMYDDMLRPSLREMNSPILNRNNPSSSFPISGPFKPQIQFN